MVGVVVMCAIAIVYMIIHQNSVKKDKFETILAYVMMTLAVGLSFLLPFQIYLDGFTELLNEMIGDLTRAVVRG